MSETHIELEIKSWERLINEIEEKKRHCIQKILNLQDELRLIQMIQKNPEKREFFKKYIRHIEDAERSTDNNYPS